MIKHILRALPPATTYLTASTGLAASALGGTTLNAFAGIGRAEGGLQVRPALLVEHNLYIRYHKCWHLHDDMAQRLCRVNI